MVVATLGGQCGNVNELVPSPQGEALRDIRSTYAVRSFDRPYKGYSRGQPSAPGGYDHVNGRVRVIKTYDRFVNPMRHHVERMAELHFELLSDDHKENILSFLAAIGQK